jgi:hypothetical protein
MAKLRSQKQVVKRCELLRRAWHVARERLQDAGNDPAVVDAIWGGEALGALLWALQLAELPRYDRPFVPDALSVVLDGADLRPGEEVEEECESARLWHWRARTAVLAAGGVAELPPRYTSLDQAVAATAMRGYERGLLPPPVRGDFNAYGRIYRHLTPAQLAEAHSLAAERHHALAWLCGVGSSWNDVPLDT